MFTTTMAFALSRPELPGRRIILVLVLFTMLFKAKACEMAMVAEADAVRLAVSYVTKAMEGSGESPVVAGAPPWR